jgi:hypothetical protein
MNLITAQEMLQRQADETRKLSGVVEVDETFMRET